MKFTFKQILFSFMFLFETQLIITSHEIRTIEDIVRDFDAYDTNSQNKKRTIEQISKEFGITNKKEKKYYHQKTLVENLKNLANSYAYYDDNEEEINYNQKSETISDVLPLNPNPWVQQKYTSREQIYQQRDEERISFFNTLESVSHSFIKNAPEVQSYGTNNFIQDWKRAQKKVYLQAHLERKFRK